MTIRGRNYLITGAAYRLGRIFALAIARRGGNIIIHHGHSPELAEETRLEAVALGVNAHVVQADFTDPEATSHLVERALSFGPLSGLINNAAIFESQHVTTTDLYAWNKHLAVNLTAPFLLSKDFAISVSEQQSGKIINILDWRALRPGSDHFPYTISKAGLAAMTKSLAVAFAPNIQVNGIALGAVLPPADVIPSDEIIKLVPARRWANLTEAEETLLFLLDGPSYITGEIIHLDGGRHLI